MLERKSRERSLRTVPAKPAVSVRPTPLPDDLMFILLAGMVGMLSGSRDVSEVGRSVENCLILGRELFKKSPAGEMPPGFELFLTLAQSGNGGVPHVGSGLPAP